MTPVSHLSAAGHPLRDGARRRIPAPLSSRAPPPQNRGGAPLFRASADVVGVEVSVRRNGRPVTELRAADFGSSTTGRSSGRRQLREAAD